MPKAVRVALPILFIAAVYCGGAPVEALQPDASDVVMAVWIAAVLVTGVANVVNACVDRGEGSPRRLAFWDMLLKLCMVPFHLLVFAAGLAMSIALAVVPGLIFAAPLMAGMLAVIDYVMLLFTSSYGFAAVLRARGQGLITSTSAAVLFVLHGLFVTDVVAAIVLYVMVRKAENPQAPSEEGPAA
ncbi:MAG: hypothetical protein QM302_03385 [Acidobacteriota bacterium]|nr:hypothetical protein [Acidobacteriota bacterium]